jgi:hypothetical protein
MICPSVSLCIDEDEVSVRVARHGERSCDYRLPVEMSNTLVSFHQTVRAKTRNARGPKSEFWPVGWGVGGRSHHSVRSWKRTPGCQNWRRPDR